MNLELLAMLGTAEVLILAAVVLTFVAVVGGIVYVVIRYLPGIRPPGSGSGPAGPTTEPAARAGTSGATEPAAEPRVPTGGAVEISVAQCPKCGTAMAPDAARGLCPKCLLEVGVGTQPSAGDVAGGASGSVAAPTPEELAARFPQLEVLDEIGRGGMGVVYRARQKKLDRIVALKVLAREAARDPAFAERFQREARALARLNHPNIVTVYDFGEVEGLFFLIQEYVDGADLRRVLQQGRLSPEEALRIVPVVCDALQYAHANGVVHRDIKPGNILMDREGRVKIADFGIAKLADASTADVTLTQSKQAMGTPHYMAPEQVESPQTVDHRADIYSLGVVFYEMLTGELPIGRFAPPSRRVRLDVRLDEVVLRALEKEPERRYQQAGEVKTEVERIAGGGAPPRALGGKLSRMGLGAGLPVGPGPRVWIAAGTVWLLFCAISFVAMQRFPSAPEASSPSPMFWLLAHFGALAPLGTTICGWLAVRAADRGRMGPRMLQTALGVLALPSTLALGFLGTLLGMAFWFEVLGFRQGNGIAGLTVSVVGTLVGLGWMLHAIRRGCLRVLSLDPRDRPWGFGWLGLLPTLLGLVATGVLLAALGTRFAQWRQHDMARLEQFLRPSPRVEAPMLGGGPVPAMSPLDFSNREGNVWSLDAAGPKFSDELMLSVLGKTEGNERNVLEAALRAAWAEYRVALRSHLRRTTNDLGRVLIEVQPMARELDAITDRFWTQVDGVLPLPGQTTMRTRFGPQLRPRWMYRPQGKVYESSGTLLRYGEMGFWFEFWREGSWYRHRGMEGEGSVTLLEGQFVNRSPELPEDCRLLLELSEAPGP